MNKMTWIGFLMLSGLTAKAQVFDWGKTCPMVEINQALQTCAKHPHYSTCLSVQGQTTPGLLPDDFAATSQSEEAMLERLFHFYDGCRRFDTGQDQKVVSARAGQITPLGQIPTGKSELNIQIKSSQDADLILLDGSVPLVQKHSGLLSDEGAGFVEYKGMRISHSGFGGDGTSAGHEFIQISGVVPTTLSVAVTATNAATIEVTYAWGLDPGLGSVAVPDRPAFDQLSAASTSPGAIGIRELKFLIKNIDSDYPSMYFMNSNQVPLHLDFAYEVLDWYPELTPNEAWREFNSSTYFLDGRTHLAGSVLAYDHFDDASGGANGLYVMQMWPTDPVSADLLVKAHGLLRATMPGLDRELVYFPASETHQQIFQDNQDLFQANGVGVIDQESLFGQVAYSALNLGEGYGRLRLFREGDPSPTVGDVVLFTFIPNDLNHVAGIITNSPQTPLSHVNLIAKQNDTPNAYLKDAENHPQVMALMDELVHYRVTADGVHLEPATQAQVDAWLDSVRPQNTQTPNSDLTITEPAPLDTLGHADWVRFGVKAANVAELANVLEPGMYPVGYAIPFAMYDEFMSLNRCQGFEDDGITPDGKFRDLCDNPSDPNGLTLYQQIEHIMADPDFQADPRVRESVLKDFRKTVKKSEVPDAMSETLESIRYFWDPDGVFTHSIRLRSSTNNEDLEGFNGAGLYESNTHHPDEGDIADSVKKVWASLWTARAFEERRFYRIDHLKTYMGVLAHLSYGDEQVNGVAVTKNIYDRNWEGYYVNAQYGEISVTNPEPIITSDGEVASIPDEFLLAHLYAPDERFEWVQQYIRRSNVETVYDLPVPTDNVLTDAEVDELRVAMQKIQAHFRPIYNGDDEFAMDIEFKITKTDDGSRGHLEIKQARPWID